MSDDVDRVNSRHDASVVSNATVLFVSRMIVAVLGWAGTILIIRNLSVDDWGRYTFVFNFLGLMIVFTNAVNARVAIRGFLDADDKSSFSGNYILLRLALGLVGYAFAMAFVVLYHYPQSVIEATAIAGLVVVVATPSVGYDAFFQIDGKLRPVAIANVLGQVAQFVLTVILAARGSSLVIFTIPAVLYELTALAWKLRSLKVIVRVRYVMSHRTWFRLLRSGLPFAVGGALGTVYYSIDAVMLSKMDTFHSVGVYGIAYKFAGVIHFLPVALSASLLAPLVRTWPEQPAVFWRTFRRAMVFLSLVAVPIAFEFLLFAKPAIQLLYGATYTHADGATRLIVISECFGFFTQLGVTTLVALKRDILFPIAALVGVLLNVGLNIYAIPRYSFHGAAAVTLITEAVVCTVLWTPIVRFPNRPPLPLGLIGKAVAVGVVCAAVGFLLGQVVPFLLAAALCGLAYVALVHGLRIAGPQGLRSLVRDDDLAEDQDV